MENIEHNITTNGMRKRKHFSLIFLIVFFSPRDFLLPKEKALKGQWFLISAVIASGAFLAISLLFNNYFVVDVSEPALIEEDYYFSMVKGGMNRTIWLSNCTINGGITNMERNLRAFSEFSKDELAKVGYFLHVEYTINDCAAKRVNYGILLASERYVRCDNVANPQSIIPGIRC